MSIRHINLDSLTPDSGDFDLSDIEIINIRDGTIAIYNSRYTWFSFALVDCLLVCLVWSGYISPGGDVDIHERMSSNERNVVSPKKEKLLALSVLSNMSQGKFDVEIFSHNSSYWLYSRPLDFRAVLSLAQVKKSRHATKIIQDVSLCWYALGRHFPDEVRSMISIVTMNTTLEAMSTLSNEEKIATASQWSV